MSFDPGDWLGHVRALLREEAVGTQGRPRLRIKEELTALVARARGTAARTASRDLAGAFAARGRRFDGDLSDSYLDGYEAQVGRLAVATDRAARKGLLGADLLALPEQAAVTGRLWQDFTDLASRFPPSAAGQLPALYLSAADYDDLRQAFPHVGEVYVQYVVLMNPVAPRRVLGERLDAARDLLAAEPELNEGEARLFALRNPGNSTQAAQTAMETAPALRELTETVTDVRGQPQTVRLTPTLARFLATTSANPDDAARAALGAVQMLVHLGSPPDAALKWAVYHPRGVIDLRAIVLPRALDAPFPSARGGPARAYPLTAGRPGMNRQSRMGVTGP